MQIVILHLRLKTRLAGANWMEDGAAATGVGWAEPPRCKRNSLWNT